MMYVLKRALLGGCLAFVFLVHPAAAPVTSEVVYFTSGRVMPIAEHRIDGGNVVLSLKGGDEVFFVQPVGDAAAMMTAPVVSREPLRTGPPQKLFDMPESDAYNFDVSADAQRFLVIRREEGAASATITIVENWYQEFAGRE